MSLRLPEVKDKFQWYFPARVGGDFASAIFSAILVAPAVTVIDRAVVEKTSSRYSISHLLRKHSVCCLKQPRRFFISKPFFIISTLYAATYSTANVSETISKDIFHVTDKASVQSIIFISTFLVNVPLGLWKDVRFAQFYGTPPDHVTKSIPKTQQVLSAGLSTQSRTAVGGIRRMPLNVCAAFLLRDAFTIFGSFTLADMLSAYIPNSLAHNPHAKSILSQLVVPALTQLVAAPVHLFGLDLYNRPHAVPVLERLSHIRRDMPSTVAARCLRLVPAFGIGCIMNRELRSFFHSQLETEQADRE